MRRRLSFGLLLVGFAASLVVVPAVSAEPGDLAPVHPLPTRVSARPEQLPVAAAPRVAKARGNGIDYHGGPVLHGAVNAYVIWYGAWAGMATKSPIITGFLKGVGGSSYYNINTTYSDGTGPVQNAVTLAGQASDAGSQGTSNLSDSQIQAIVAGAITSGRLPKDSNGVYFVLTSPDVSKTGFLTQYCGWHTSATISSADIKFAFVGDPTGPSLNNCAAQTISPNGDAGADAMVSVIAHELEEATTDPNLNAWYDNRGYENADKCAWTFGTTYRTSNGASANMTLGGLQFLIQRNWVNASGGYCALSY